jgi:hypothetical protein
MTDIGEVLHHTAAFFFSSRIESAILPGYYLNLEKFPLCSDRTCAAIEKCALQEACPGASSLSPFILL